MTNNQTKAHKYLSQIRNADREINDLILQIDYLRYKASGAGAIRYDKDRVQTSPEDMLCDAITEAVVLEKKLSARHQELITMRNNTEQIISLWNNNAAKFIDIYYLLRGSMMDAAKQIGCTSRNIYFIKLKALEAFGKHLQDIV